METTANQNLQTSVTEAAVANFVQCSLTLIMHDFKNSYQELPARML